MFKSVGSFAYTETVNSSDRKVKQMGDGVRNMMTEGKYMGGGGYSE
jgi:hypothetical protein